MCFHKQISRSFCSGLRLPHDLGELKSTIFAVRKNPLNGGGAVLTSEQHYVPSVCIFLEFFVECVLRLEKVKRTLTTDVRSPFLLPLCLTNYLRDLLSPLLLIPNNFEIQFLFRTLELQGQLVSIIRQVPTDDIEINEADNLLL